MSQQQGVPPLPPQLASDPELSGFCALWRRVLQWDAGDSLTPLAAPHTALAVTNEGLSRMTPMDVSDPFVVDQQLQRTLLRRHLLTQAVREPGSVSTAASLAGEQVKVQTTAEGVTFAWGDHETTGQLQGEAAGAAVVYAVDAPFVSCGEISDAIGRHPQENPFLPPEPELMPEPQ